MYQPENMNCNTTISDIDAIKYVKLGSYNYCITQLLEDLEWLARTVTFSKSFSDYLLYVNKSKKTSVNCTIDVFSDSNFDIVEKSPFLKYKEEVKRKYKNIVIVLKQLYNTALALPDRERVVRTIISDFTIENDIFLKHPDFIIDHFIYHTYSHNHITDNYEKVLNIIKVFEYLYYKTINHITELEFDVETYIQPCYIDRSYS
jgi:hypothetical protein